jgi:hypothetical protein
LRVQAANSPSSFEVTTDGVGVVGHAGAALLRELADRLGLTRGLGWGGPQGRRRHPDVHVLLDLAVMPVWLELVLAAQDLTCWTQALLLDGGLAVAEPKTLRYRLLHVAARIVRHARRTILRLERSWPWAAELARAFTRLRAMPLRC